MLNVITIFINPIFILSKIKSIGVNTGLQIREKYLSF